MSKDAIMNQIAEQISVCQDCELYRSRKNTVPGTGAVQTEVMLIGEAPGYYENEQGKPFVGASGKFLTHLLMQGGFNREDVFITNVVKCRPPENRAPQLDELKACARYLNHQIEVIDPEIIVTLGRFSLAKFLPNARISQIHGKPMWVRERLIVPMYHPAAALHNPRLRPVLEKDYARLPELIETSKERRRLAQEKLAALERKQKQNQPTESDDGNEPVQLKLF
ncbi:MAG: uracil-DNA glycosylase [Anaerolineaceae bacterium]|nr:uracil-DNA glycosylase [Anaerolineaceae bacterium]